MTKAGKQAEWAETTLGECVTFVSGGTPSRERSDYWGAGIPWLSAKDMKRFFVHDTEEHLTDKGREEATRLVPAGTTLLLTRGMTLLNDVPVCVTRREMAFNQDVKALLPSAQVDSAFLPYFLLANKPALLNMVDLAGHGTGRLNTDSLKQIDFLLPPLPTQRAIARILGALDNKIELNRRMNETLEATARAIFKSWFIDFDPVRSKAEGRKLEGMDAITAALFPDSFEDSELGEVPKGWGCASVGDLATVVGGSTPSTSNQGYWEGGEHCWATPKDLAPLTSPVLLDTERRVTDEGLSQISSGLLPKGTVLLSSRAPIGYLAIAEVPVAVNQGFIAMKPKAGVSNFFLMFWARSAHEEILSRANGSTFLEISKSNFRPIPVVRPDEQIFSAFDRLAQPLYESIVSNARESRTLSALRDALLPKLISGEIDLGKVPSYG